MDIFDGLLFSLSWPNQNSEFFVVKGGKKLMKASRNQGHKRQLKIKKAL
jgi:hypothetical protein